MVGGSFEGIEVEEALSSTNDMNPPPVIDRLSGQQRSERNMPTYLIHVKK